MIRKKYLSWEDKIALRHLKIGDDKRYFIGHENLKLKA